MGMGLTLAGLGLSALGAYGGLRESQAQADELRRQANQERANAEQENRRSYDAFHQGEVEARRRSQQLAQLQGANRVGTAGSGLLVGEGGGTTQADAWATNADAAAADIDVITGNAKLQQDALDTSAANRRTRASRLDAQADQTERAGTVGALLKVGMAIGSAGLGMWGSSVYEGASGALAEGLASGNRDLLLQGMQGMEKSSLINAGGSMLAGLGGGRTGQAVYETGMRYNAAMTRLDAYEKKLKGGQDAVTRTFGLGLF